MLIRRTSIASMLAGAALSTLFAAGTAWSIAGVDFPSHSMEEAKAEVDKGAFEDARPMLEEILRFEPENADAYNLLGYTLRNLNELDLAMENYDKALSIDPAHANALEYQGELFLKLGRKDDADKNLVKIAEVCPSGCEAHTVLQAAIERFKDGKFTWTQASGN